MNENKKNDLESALFHRLFDEPIIGVGTWAWGDKLFWGFEKYFGIEDIRSVFKACHETGRILFDTAEIYGQGKSEKILGDLFREFGKNSILCTKFMPYPWRLSRGSLIRAVHGSLKRLGLEIIDLYQMHWPTPPVTIDAWMEAMVGALEGGLVRAVGVSNYNRQQTEKAQNTLLRHGYRLASNQVEFNLLNRGIEKTGLLDYCNEQGIKNIAYSPLAQGLLTGKYSIENPPNGARRGIYGRHLLISIQPLIRKLRSIGIPYGDKNPAQVALNWAICKGVIPIPGIKTQNQLEDYFGALNWRLNNEDIQMLDDFCDQLFMKK